MKSTIIKIMLLLAILCESTQYTFGKRYNSRTDEYYHFGYVSFSGGYSSLHENISEMYPLGGFSGFVGVGYEFRVKGFWLTVGGDVQLYRTNSEINGLTFNHPANDTQGKAITMHYTVKQQDTQEWVYANVPVMIGGYYKGFYGGAGLKVGWPIVSQSVSKSDYTTTATYKEYIADFTEMPDHYYGTYQSDKAENLKLRPNVSIIGELGYDVLSQVESRQTLCHILKLGVYAEYGLCSVINDRGQGTNIIYTGNATEIMVPPYLYWADTSNKRVTPYSIGVKLTYVFGGKGTGTFHKGCMCYD